MNDNNERMSNSNLSGEIGQIKKHESQLLQQNMDFLQKLARLEVTQDHLKESQVSLSKKIDDVKEAITSEIRISIGARINDISALVQQQQEIQNKIVEIQARQGEQIDEINRTLKEFSNMETKMIDHETRLKSLEKQITRLDDVDKTRTQGKWSLITAIASGLIAIVGGLVTLLLK